MTDERTTDKLINPSRPETVYGMCRLAKPLKYPKAWADLTDDEVRGWIDTYKRCSVINYTYGWEKEALIEATHQDMDMLFFFILQGMTWEKM